MLLQRIVLTLGMAVGLINAAYAGVLLSEQFADDMVLQREQPIAVWGNGVPGEIVTVAIARQSGSSTTGPDGVWRVFLKPLPEGDPLI